ncbi:BLUF domain-containing protein [Oleisolibacter albus]|uniref:BLUF domain-containing protein n=1 Tax=Oleisolibacter albus TaxID=2171757 RepID=UPI000DF32AF8|nr:BLUF domain-containing protein [Oleisolibacter albus]
MSADDLLCLVYISRSAGPVSDDALLALLVQARSNNARDGITGMLLYKGGYFMQALEGPNALVQALYRRICLDPRHRDVTTLIKFQPDGRAFDGWTMGFANIDRIPPEQRAGISPFLDQDFEPASWAEAPHQAMRLLRAFRDVNGDSTQDTRPVEA